VRLIGVVELELNLTTQTSTLVNSHDGGKDERRERSVTVVVLDNGFGVERGDDVDRLIVITSMMG
jgi:hypothetical protein